MFKNFSLGFNTYGDAHKFIVKHKLWWYVFIPGFINLVLFAVVLFLGYLYAGKITFWLMDLLGLNTEPENFLRYLVRFLRFILNLIFQIIMVLVYISSYKYIVLMIMSPVLAVLSEKTEKLLSGKDFPFRLAQLLKDIVRGNLIVIRNIMLELLAAIVLFFAGYIPILGYLAPFILMMISFYFYGFSMIDYSSERHKLKIRESVKFVRKNKGFAIANGMVFYFLLMIPFVGILVAPAYSIIAATIGVEKINNQAPKIKKTIS